MSDSHSRDLAAGYAGRPRRDSQGHLIGPDLTADVPVFTRGEGVRLIDGAGREYLDAAAGVGVTCLGYGVREVADSMHAQAGLLPYVHAMRFESEPARELASLVAEVTPGDLDHVFFASGGSEAVESAVKFARQYWLERGEPDRWRVIGRQPSFHGNTLTTLAIGWHAARRKAHAPWLVPLPHPQTPNTYRGCGHCRSQRGCTLACAADLEQAILEAGPRTVAAFIAEPVVIAAAGAMVPPPEYFPAIGRICDRHDVLLIADEVFTGFGRLGRWFGIERFGVQPDIIVFAKGVAGGYAPLGGFAAPARLLGPFRRGSGRFEHNFTYAGHPVATAAGRTVVTILRRDRLIERVAALEPRFLGMLHDQLDDLPLVGDVRGMGLLAGVELVADRRTRQPFGVSAKMAARATRYAQDDGLIVYPCTGGAGGEAGDYLLLAPPFVTSEQDLELMAALLRRALARLGRDLGARRRGGNRTAAARPRTVADGTDGTAGGPESGEDSPRAGRDDG